MSPLRGRKIRRIYINSDNCNESASNRINNLDFEFDGNYSFCDENFRYNHLRKLSKVAAAFNIPHHVQTNNGIAPLSDVSFSNGGIHVKAAPACQFSDNVDGFHINKELIENIAVNVEGVREDETSPYSNAANATAIQAFNPSNIRHFENTNNGIAVGRGSNTDMRSNEFSEEARGNVGININNICSSNLIDSDIKKDNYYIKNLTPMQIRYLQRTQKLLSYEIPQYKSGIKQLLSIPEYLPCDI
ncbi:hypothetical protein FG386_002361 [Cryptosporidium ryanae]|uniref:uncharacterized protein n=1 Tax=Cryptosporidium ryanae TaxID=515981 RepID=UPI00351A8BDF|nr:hypothetical protein FG386_002361 [Cryptosporidium ryanae]